MSWEAGRVGLDEEAHVIQKAVGARVGEGGGVCWRGADRKWIIMASWSVKARCESLRTRQLERRLISHGV